MMLPSRELILCRQFPPITTNGTNSNRLQQRYSANANYTKLMLLVKRYRFLSIAMFVTSKPFTVHCLLLVFSMHVCSSSGPKLCDRQFPVSIGFTGFTLHKWLGPHSLIEPTYYWQVEEASSSIDIEYTTIERPL